MMCIRFKKITLKLLFLFAVAFAIQGCSSVAYYTQGIVGHTSLMLARKPVDKVIKNADETLKAKLITSQQIRRFSIEELGLPDNKSYRSYVALKNASPVWNVVAAKEFSLKPKQWCYLVIGCASYRGYYSKKTAERYASKLKKKGYDVRVAGVGAYSTLGFFADPLTSAMVSRDDASLAELIFHELSHQKVYIKNNTRFNEAFATVVGEQGAIFWMKENKNEALLLNYKERLMVQKDFISLVKKTKEKLTALYESNVEDDAKRAAKADVFSGMKKDYEKLKKHKWDGKAWYGRWFSEPINNARLVSIATYHDLVPDFLALFERCNKDFSRFYDEVADIGKDKKNKKEKIVSSMCKL